jgi:hypothetical protein
MTKGSGLFLIPGFLFAVLYAHRWKSISQKYVWLYLAVFILVSSPLYIRNVVVFGDPFFNVGTAQLAYENDVLDNERYFLYSSEAGQAITVWPEKQGGTSHLSAGLKGMGHRLLRSFKAQGESFLDLLNIWPAKRHLSPRMRHLFGLFMTVLLMVGLFNERDSRKRVYVISSLLSFVVFLSVFPPLSRYVLPVLSLAWIYVGLGTLCALNVMRQLLSKIYLPGLARGLSTPILLLVIVGFVFFYGVVKYPVSDPRQSVDFSDSRRDLLEWMRKNLRNNDKYIEGPNFSWQMERGTWIIAPKNSREDLDKFKAFIDNVGVKYIVIDWYSLTVNRYRGEHVDRLQQLDGYFRLDEQLGIVQENAIDGWELAYEDFRKKKEFMVFKSKKAI